MCMCHMYWTAWAQNIPASKELDSTAYLCYLSQKTGRDSLLPQVSVKTETQILYTDPPP